MNILTEDARYAVRRLRRSPAFALTAILILALGIGANTAIFSVLKQAFLAKPPFADPDRLVMVDLTLKREDDEPRARAWSYPKFEILRTSARELEGVAAHRLRSVTLSGGGQPRRLQVEIVSANYFQLLRVDAQVGRTFVPEEDDPSVPASVVLLGHGLWTERFGADPDVVGQSVVLENNTFSVVGVLPEGFEGLSGRAEAWAPMAGSAPLMGRNYLIMEQAHWFRVIGRLAPGAGLERAREEMASIGRSLREAIPRPVPNEVEGVDLVSLREARENRTTRTSVALLAAALALVLLIACANVAGLVLARGISTQRDTAIRAAMGAGRGRLVRHLAAESLALSLMGGAVGLLVAAWGVDLIAAALPRSLGTSGTRGLEFLDPTSLGLDRGIFLFGFLLSLVTGLAAGLIPALRLSRPDLTGALKEGAGSTRQGSITGRRLGSQGLLVASQVAMAVVLTVSAGLMLRSLTRLNDVDIGIDPDRMLTFEYELASSDPWVDRPHEFHQALLGRLRALPGVQGATIGCPPLSECNITVLTEIVGKPPYEEGSWPEVGMDYVGDDHFRVLGTPLLRGREFAPADRAGAPLVVLLNETAAREFFSDEEPLGQRLSLGIGNFYEQTAEVVGVVGDVVYGRLEAETAPHVFLPFRQEPVRWTTVMLRTSGDPKELVPVVRHEVYALIPNLAIAGVSTMRERLSARTARTRVIAVLLALFGATALLLTAAGLYGVIAFSVARQTRELGLRMALGAVPGSLLRQVLLRGATLATLGIAFGVGIALLATRLLRALLYDVSTTDPVTFAVASGLIMGVTLLASYLPARRAARVDPIVALRYE